MLHKTLRNLHRIFLGTKRWFERICYFFELDTLIDKNLKKRHLIVFLCDKMVNWVKLNTKMLNITKKNFWTLFLGRGTENGQKIRQLIFLVILVFWSSDFVSLIYFIKGRSSAKIKFLTLFILLFLTNPYFRGISDQREERN